MNKLADALDRTIVIGPHSNVTFLAALCRAPGFKSKEFDTGFIDRNLERLVERNSQSDGAAVARGAQILMTREIERLAVRRDPDAPQSPWDIADAFQFSGPRSVDVPLIVDGRAAHAVVSYADGGQHMTVDGAAPDKGAAAIEAGEAVYIVRHGRQTQVRLPDAESTEVGGEGDGGIVRAPMHGKLLAVVVESGAKVAKGQPIAIVEAMKMEHTLTAPAAGVVSEVRASAGAQVAEGAVIVVIETDASRVASSRATNE